MQNLVQIGKTRKTYGVRGEVKLQLEDNYLDDIELLEVVFLEINGKPIPYFVEAVNIGSNILIKFEEIDSPEAAHEVVSKNMFARREDLIPEDQKEPVEEVLHFAKFIGFTIIDQETGRVGVIDDVIEFPQQEMAVVNEQDRELLIPLNETLITESNLEAKLLFMNLPEGLLDL